jgi:hypothetical protein
MNQLVPLPSVTLTALVAAAGERAGMRFLEFFAANIRNPHTRRPRMNSHLVRERRRAVDRRRAAGVHRKAACGKTARAV